MWHRTGSTKRASISQKLHPCQNDGSNYNGDEVRDDIESLMASDDLKRDLSSSGFKRFGKRTLLLLLAGCAATLGGLWLLGHPKLIDTAVVDEENATKGQVSTMENGGQTLKEGDESCSAINIFSTQINARPNIIPPNFCNTSSAARQRCVEAADGLFIHPPSNFAFCRIEKNACSSWLRVLNKIYHNDTNIKIQDYHLPQKSLEKFGVEGLEEIFSNPNSVRAVMVRDPLARFASAFFSKCFSFNCNDRLCYPRTYYGLPRGQPISFRTALDWILDNSTDVTEEGEYDSSRIDGHYTLQAAHCDL